MTTAIGYMRVSTETQLDGFGPEVQRDAITNLAIAEGMRLDRIYFDEGICGAEDLTVRRALADALDHLSSGEATVLIIPRLDRLARDLVIQEQVLAEAWRTGARVLPCSETERTYCQPDNADDPSRTLIRQVLGAVAAYERAMIRLRLRTGRRRRIERDGWAGGPEPYGWSDPTEQAVLAHVAAARRTGRSWRSIADELNAAGYGKRNGAPWNAGELHRAHQRAEQRRPIEPQSLRLTPTLAV